MAKLILFGNTDFTDVIHWYFDNLSPHTVVAFTVNADYITDETRHGLPVVPFETLHETHPPDEHQMFVAVGYHDRNRLRHQLVRAVTERGYQLAHFVHPSVSYPRNMPLAPNTFILEQVVIQPFVSIGSDVFIWSNTVISHHTTIGDHCFITHNVALSGHVTVEAYCFIGANATIRDNITLAQGTVIGAGATILHDTTPNAVHKAQHTPQDDYLTTNLKRI